MAGALATILQRFREGATEPVFFGDQPRPEGVVISFEQWAEYEELKSEVEFEQRTLQIVRDRIADPRASEDSVSFEDMMEEFGLDPDTGKPVDPARQAVNYHLIVHAELRQDMTRLHAEWKQDSNSPAGREFQAAADALRALREGRESEYEGKQLGHGPSTYDLRDAAELKVPVFDERSARGGRSGRRTAWSTASSSPPEGRGRPGRARPDRPALPAGRRLHPSWRESGRDRRRAPGTHPGHGGARTARYRRRWPPLDRT